MVWAVAALSDSGGNKATHWLQMQQYRVVLAADTAPYLEQTSLAGSREHLRLAGHIAARCLAPSVRMPAQAVDSYVLCWLDGVQEGKPIFQPGLLAEAHRGILYVDELNLLGA